MENIPLSPALKNRCNFAEQLRFRVSFRDVNFATGGIVLVLNFSYI